MGVQDCEAIVLLEVCKILPVALPSIFVAFFTVIEVDAGLPLVSHDLSDAGDILQLLTHKLQG